MVVYQHIGFHFHHGAKFGYLVLISYHREPITRHHYHILVGEVVNLACPLERNDINAILLTKIGVAQAQSHKTRKLRNGNPLHVKVVFECFGDFERLLCLPLVEVVNEMVFNAVVESECAPREQNHKEHKCGNNQNETKSHVNVAPNGQPNEKDGCKIAQQQHRYHYSTAAAVNGKHLLYTQSVDIFYHHGPQKWRQCHQRDAYPNQVAQHRRRAVVLHKSVVQQGFQQRKRKERQCSENGAIKKY